MTEYSKYKIQRLQHMITGPTLGVVLILAAWIGYSIGKEAKTNWFSEYVSRKSVQEQKETKKETLLD